MKTEAETLLECARKALPCYQWFLCDGLVVRTNGMRSSKRIQFDIGRYWPDLQIALEREGWHFGWRNFDPPEYFEAWKGFYGFQSEILFAPTKPELLIAIVRQGDS